MKHLVLISAFISQLVFARVPNDVYRMPLTGNVPGWGILSRLSLPPVGIVETGALTANQSGAINAWADLTGGTVTLTTVGRPVLVSFQTTSTTEGSPGAGVFFPAGQFTCTNSNPGINAACAIGINVNGTPSGSTKWESGVSGGSGTRNWIPCSTISWVLTPPSGSNTFQVRWAGGFISASVFTTVGVDRCKLTAREL